VVVTVELRPPRLEEAAALAAMFAEFARAFGTEHDFQQDIESWFTNPGMDLESDARIALLDGEIAGYVDASDAGRVGSAIYIDLRFHPDHPELLEPLFDFAEGRAQELIQPGGTIRVWRPETAEEVRALIEGRGYAFNNYSFRMGRELDGEIAEPQWPEDIELRPFDRENDSGLVYEVNQEVFEDEPGHVREPYVEWVHWAFSEPFDPELWFLAFDGGELAGLCRCRPKRGVDRDQGWVQALGVRRPWRRRGLGRALLLHSFREFQARGKRRVGLGVSGENESAVQLYESAGMKVERTSVWYRKDA
jgi:mycothiol synthase